MKIQRSLVPFAAFSFAMAVMSATADPKSQNKTETKVKDDKVTIEEKHSHEHPGMKDSKEKTKTEVKRDDDGDLKIKTKTTSEGPHSSTGMRFHGLDANSDGRITRSEWKGNDVSFSNHDWNGDGVISGSEVIAGARRPDDDDFGKGRFGILDANHDGRLNRSEWLGHGDSFDRLDRNHDGWLSSDEFFDPAPRTREQTFSTWDHNSDSSLNRSEWHSDVDSFNRLDRNYDGIVSRNEFLNR